MRFGNPPSEALQPERAATRLAWMLRIGIAAVGVLLVLASRLPWFSLDVESAQIVDRYLLSDEVFRSLIGYRVSSDRLIIAVLGGLIALTAGLWAWRVGLLLSRPLLLLFSGLVVCWSTLAITEAGTIPSESGATEGMTASIGPWICLALGVAVFVATIFARLASSDLTASYRAIDRMLLRGRGPVAAVFSRRLVEAVQRARGPGDSDTIRIALTHAECLAAAGFPDLALLVIARIEARPELPDDPEADAFTRRMRAELATLVDDDGAPRGDYFHP
jgi:hypothetical protein